jgi:group I intron endonuclease
MICTIYLLTNIINNKIYIGQTWLPLKIRMGTNGKNYKNCNYLYSSIKKYGIENFKYKTLAFCDTQNKADIAESLLINFYKSRDNKIGYNIKDGGSCGKHSIETKIKISKSIKNKVWSIKALINKSNSGKAWLGKKRGKQSQDRINKTIANMKTWHANNNHPMLNKKHSKEALVKISNASKKAWENGKYSKESIKRGSEARRMDIEREINIIKSYNDGIIISNIEKMYLTSRSSIYRILKRNNILKKQNNI